MLCVAPSEAVGFESCGRIGCHERTTDQLIFEYNSSLSIERTVADSVASSLVDCAALESALRVSRAPRMLQTGACCADHSTSALNTQG